MFCQKYEHNLYRGKRSPKYLFGQQKTTQSKQSLNRRKFAQSGHPPSAMFLIMYVASNILPYWQKQTRVTSRVARWFIFKPKIPFWVNFGGSWNGKCWYIL
jgi:hypothetical protein